MIHQIIINSKNNIPEIPEFVKFDVKYCYN